MTHSAKAGFVVIVAFAVLVIANGDSKAVDTDSSPIPSAIISNSKQYDLVFEGGGAKGMVFIGAYDEFRRRGYKHGRLLGTSAGAITAVLIAAGYTPDEMLMALTEKKDGKSVFSSFMGDPPPLTNTELGKIESSDIFKMIDSIHLGFWYNPDFYKPINGFITGQWAKIIARSPKFGNHLYAFTEYGGWYSAIGFVEWLQKKLNSGFWLDDQLQQRKREFSNRTLLQFFQETKVNLSVVASDTTAGRWLVLNHLTAPDCPLVWAVRMSMSIPLVWDEVIWKKEWGKYRGNDITEHAIVDGGILTNFPIELFISKDKEIVKMMGPQENNPVLGLLIDETLPLAVQPDSKPLPDQPVSRSLLRIDTNKKKLEELKTVERLNRLVETMSSARDKMVIEENEEIVVRLPAAGYKTTDFDMSNERREALVNAGKTAMAKYLDKLSKKGEEKGSGAATQREEAANRVAAKMMMRGYSSAP